MDYTEYEYIRAYDNLIALLDDSECDPCVLSIPHNWSIEVLECVDAILTICPAVKLKKIFNFNNKLSIDFELDPDSEYCRAYIEDEIYFANINLPEENKMIGIGGNSAAENCCECKVLITKFNTVKASDGKYYCKSCYTKINPPTLVVKENSTGTKFINGTKTDRLNIKELRKNCDWFLRRMIVKDSGEKTYYFEYKGDQTCRQFINREKDTPNYWTRCPKYGSCPF